MTDELARRVLRALGPQARTRDELAAELAADADDVEQALRLAERRGWVRPVYIGRDVNEAPARWHLTDEGRRQLDEPD